MRGRIGEEELQGIGALAEKLPRADRAPQPIFRLPAAKPIVSSKGPTPCNPRCA